MRAKDAIAYPFLRPPVRALFPRFKASNCRISPLPGVRARRLYLVIFSFLSVKDVRRGQRRPKQDGTAPNVPSNQCMLLSSNGYGRGENFPRCRTEPWLSFRVKPDTSVHRNSLNENSSLITAVLVPPRDQLVPDDSQR